MLVMLNHEVFTRDPLTSSIPNNGVATITEPQTEQQWTVLRFELESFVCAGQYHQGLLRILEGFQKGLHLETQPAVWVSGFYGSGKSHLVRVLEHLWRNLKFSDQRSARDVVQLPPDLKALLQELEMEGRRNGGLWAAAGKLGDGPNESIRLAVLGIVYRAAGLPMTYPQARFCLWLKELQIFEPIKKQLVALEKTLEHELLNNFYFSTPLANAILETAPDLANSSQELRTLIRTQFPEKNDLNEDEFKTALEQVLKMQSSNGTQLPLTLLVLDELQVYINEDANRMRQVQDVIESITKSLGSKLLVVATGQSAMQASTQLAKLQARFTLQIPLQQSDVQYVLRKVVLEKKPDRRADVAATLEHHSGEIDRQLSGTRIAPNATDKLDWVADYPLLPSRRRFWDAVIQAVDRSGTNAQLRNQLRTLHRSTQAIADKPLGWVIPADAIYHELRQDLLTIGVLMREVDETIYDLGKDGSNDGKLRSRLAALCFLISQVPSTDPTGLRSNAETLMDLLIDDLGRGSELRQRVPPMLEGLVTDGKLVLIDNEYKLQTLEGREWEATFRQHLSIAKGDTSRVSENRTKRLEVALQKQLKGINVQQGDSRTPRSLGYGYGADLPEVLNDVPVWVRDGWNNTENEVKNAAIQLGMESPVVTLFIPKTSHEEIKDQLEHYIACVETLNARHGEPTTPEGKEAKAGITTKKQLIETKLDSLISSVVSLTRVFQGGGSEVSEGLVKASLERAASAGVARLYKEFKVADYANWGKVFDKAKEGNASALEQIGFIDKPPADFPICKQILNFVAAGKRGSDISKHFKSAPFGYPQDAIQGCLLVLLVSGDLKATQNGQAVSPKQLDRREIEKTDFRSEVVVITALEKIGLKKFFQTTNVTMKSEDYLGAAESLLDQMQRLAKEAGGEAPAPISPSTAQLETLRGMNGNGLLKAIFGWQNGVRFYKFAETLAIYNEITPQFEALRVERGLLIEPDPVPNLVQQLQNALRLEVLELHNRLQNTFATLLTELEHQTVWLGLSPAVQDEILLQNNLEAPSSLDLSSEQTLGQALEKMGVPARRTQIDALRPRFERALEEAVKRSAPETIRLKLPTRTLYSSTDVKGYLTELETQLMQHIDAGKPVMVS
jgi:ATP:corrinoid adenosyltransferase